MAKSFVSIFFSNQSLQLVQLDKAHKSISKHLSVSLPPGVVDNRKVLDVHSLAAILKNAWKKGGFKETSVGLVVPEFSTFTKNIKVPKLKASELNEAVRWQAQEYLPWDADDMVLDWKLIKKDKETVSTLAVAIEKGVLQGFVDAASFAGLFPLVVETPSLSLVRIEATDPVGKLIVYDNFGEGLVVIAKGAAILASSSVDLSGSNASTVISQILSHYSDTSVEKIVYGGGPRSRQLAESVAKKLGKPASELSVVASSLVPNIIQEFLIPISLQFESTSGPSDEETVNLLPSDWAKRYSKQKLQSQAWGLTTIVSIFTLITLLATLGVYFFFLQQIAGFNSRIVTNGKASEEAEVIKAVADLNMLSTKTLAIKKRTISPEAVFNLIISAKPAGITIAGYKMDLDVGRVEVTGLAANLQNVIDFKIALEATGLVESVSIPISNFAGETDIDYNLSFIYKNSDNGQN